MFGSTVQHRLKLTAIVASSVVMTPVFTFWRLETMEGKLAMRTLADLIPAGERLGVFMRVASWTGSSLAKAMAVLSLVELFGSSTVAKVRMGD